MAIVSDDFAGMAKVIAKAYGIEHVPTAIYPGVILTDGQETFEGKARDMAVDLIGGLTSDGNGPAPVATEAGEAVPGQRDIIFTGNYDEFTEHFLFQGWSEGLPVAPPTIPRIEAFLKFTDRDPDEVLGILPPALREATVWNVAANGVMAGCRPEYFPVLLAIVEALADPRFRLEDAGSTPGWEPLVTVSGKVVRDLNFNTGSGALRVGRQANTSIGRFVRLYMRNIAGLLIPPGQTDQGAISSTFNVALAENEDAIERIGWQPYRVDCGYDVDDSTVTLRSVVTISAPIYSGGGHADDHLETIGRLFGDAIGPWCYHAYVYGSWYHLLVLGPSIARRLAEDGVTKDDVRQYLYDNVKIEADWVRRYGPQVSGKRFDWKALAEQGKAPMEYAESTDPNLHVRQFLKPEWIDIVVAGNPGRNQSRAYVGNHNQGIPTSKRITLPTNWSDLLAER